MAGGARIDFIAADHAPYTRIEKEHGTVWDADRDLVVIDPNGSWTVRSEDLFYKQGWSALEGETLDGRIEQTVIRGRVVYDRGEIKVVAGYGEFIMPARGTGAAETLARKGEAVTA